MIQEMDQERLIEGFITPYYGATADHRDRYIFEPRHLTVSTVHGAKGYDAMVVFMIGVDHFSDSPEGRATFYVGATRSKLALYLTGVEAEDSLLDEAQAVLKRFH